MNKQQILKGFWMMLGVLLTAFEAGTNIWPVAVLTAVLTGGVYYVSNFIVTSNSDPNSFNFKDILKGLILGVLAGCMNYIVSLADPGTFTWQNFGAAALAALLSYVGLTAMSQKTKSA